MVNFSPLVRRTGILVREPLILFLIISLVPTLLCSLTGCSGSNDNPDPAREVLFQVSTIDALMDGLYDGVISLDKLNNYGDFGIGTFENLDGEMVQTGGDFYQVKADGIAYQVSGAVMTPFACVTFFDADRELQLPAGLDYEQLTAFLDEQLPTVNIFYAVKIEGAFSYMKTRSVPAQEKPYPRLAEVTENQAVFEFHDIEGTVVGFRCPPYVTGVNVPGYHLHFLTADRDAGGHILELNVRDAVAAIDDTSDFRMQLPGDGSDFYKLDLSSDKQSEIEKVEK